jgi:hypothetical protein
MKDELPLLIHPSSFRLHPLCMAAASVGVRAAVNAHYLFMDFQLSPVKTSENPIRSPSGTVVAPCGCKAALGPSATVGEE